MARSSYTGGNVRSVLRRTAVLLAALALVAGCGDDPDEAGDVTTATGPVATDVCLGERGFSLRPSTSGISAVAPNGVEFTIAFFDTPVEASAAAEGADGSTAVANAVVTPSGKRLARADLETIEECVSGAD